MSVKKEASGRRSVQVEVEVPGTPEEVWQAIATGPGISSWMVTAEFEERDGKPVAVKMNFGPGMESCSSRGVGSPRRTSQNSAAWSSTSARVRTTPSCGSTSRGRAPPRLAPSTSAARAWSR